MEATMSEEEVDTDSSLEYASSCGSSDVDELDDDIADWTPTLGDADTKTRVIELCGTPCCSKLCLRDREHRVEKFVHSVTNMTKEAKRTSLLTALAISSSVVATKQQVGRGERERYVYFLPFCGEVCIGAFQSAYEVSQDTITRCRNQVRAGHGYLLPHKNTNNRNAAKLDETSVSRWLRSFAERVGDECAMRFRTQRTENGVTTRYVTKQRIVFIPAYFTWETLRTEYENYLIATSGTVDTTRLPSLRSFKRIASDRCHDVCVRAPRSNVCDLCVVYQLAASREMSTIETKNAAMHALDSRAMREQYAKDIGTISAEHCMTTIDFAQNIALPHVASTPSAWYFLSLIGVSLFGVFSENAKHQTNYVFSERMAAKGSNEVVSMLDLYARANNIYGSIGEQLKSWTIYADNCGGQNKNNHVIRYLRFLVDTGRLKSANLYFFVKGHTKNNCDRGCGTIKRAYVKQDLYTMDQVTAMIEASSTANSCVNLKDRQGVFKDWKTVLEPVYKDLHGIQKYQLFNMESDSPGVVYCRKRPSGHQEAQDIRRKKSVAVNYNAVVVTTAAAPPPVVNPEKVTDLHKKILPFIPEDYRSDALYRAPTAGEFEASAAKRSKCSSIPVRKRSRER